MADDTVWIRIRYDTRQARRDLAELDRAKPSSRTVGSEGGRPSAPGGGPPAARGGSGGGGGIQPTFDLSSVAAQIAQQSSVGQGLTAKIESMVGRMDSLITAVNNMLPEPLRFQDESIRTQAENKAANQVADTAGRVAAAGGQLSGKQMEQMMAALVQINERQLTAQQEANARVRPTIPGARR